MVNQSGRVSSSNCCSNQNGAINLEEQGLAPSVDRSNRVIHQLHKSRVAPATDSDPVEVAGARKLKVLQFVNGANRSQDHVIRQIAKELRKELDEFIQAGITSPAKIGFHAVVLEPLSSRNLKEALYLASRKLEDFFNRDSDRSPLGISMRSFSQNVQGVVDSFRVFLTRQDFSDSVPQSQQGSIVQAVIEFKQEISSVIQQMDAFVVKQALGEMRPEREQ